MRSPSFADDVPRGKKEEGEKVKSSFLLAWAFYGNNRQESKSNFPVIAIMTAYHSLLKYCFMPNSYFAVLFFLAFYAVVLDCVGILKMTSRISLFISATIFAQIMVL